MRIWSDFLGGASAQTRYSSDEVTEWLRGGLGGIVTATGLRVTIEDARTVPGVSACIGVLKEDLSKVPLTLFRRNDDGSRVQAEDHPLYWLLKNGPAPWKSAFSWRMAMWDAALSHGNAYSRINRSSIGQLGSINFIQPGRTTPRWAADSEPYYDVRADTGHVERNLTWQDVIHLAYQESSDCAANGGTTGVSPLSRHRESLALALAAERFAARFFANGAHPSFVLETEKRLPTDEVAKRMRSDIERLYSGLDNSFKVAVLELGVKLHEFTGNNDDSQLVEIRKAQAVEVCSMYRMPPHKIGILDRATFSNIEHQGIDYVTGPVSGLAKGFESAIGIACLTPEERKNLYVEHNLEGLLRGDIATRYRAYSLGRQWGWLNVDEIREFENMNKLPDKEGQEYLKPLNMIPAGEKVPMPDDPTDPPSDDDKPPPKKSLMNGHGRYLYGPTGNIIKALPN